MTADLGKGYWWVRKEGERARIVRLTTARDKTAGDDASGELYVQQMGSGHDLTVEQLIDAGYRFLRRVELSRDRSMTRTSSLDPDIRMAIALALKLPGVLDQLIGFSPSLPVGVEKGSEEQRLAIMAIGEKFLPRIDPLTWEPPSEPQPMPAVLLTTAEIATVIEALQIVTHGAVWDQIDSHEALGSKNPEEIKRFVDAVMERITKARTIYRYEEDDEISPIAH